MTNTKPCRPALRTLDADSLRHVHGGALNTYFSKVQGEKQGDFKGEPAKTNQ